MEERKFKKNIEKAIRWLATEHNFFKELTDDLKELKQDISKSKEKAEVKDIRHALRDFRYIGRAERRFNRYEQNVEEVLNDLKKKISISGTAEEVEQLVQRIHTEAANLIRDSSFYEGKIKEHLVKLRDDIKYHETEAAQSILMEVSQTIEDAEKWIGALSIDLKEADKVTKKITKKIEMPIHSAILILEDDDFFQRIFVETLDAMTNRSGTEDIKFYPVEDLEHLRTMLDIMITFRSDLKLAIVDFDFPGGNGNQAAELIRKAFPKAVIIGNTGGPPKFFDKRYVNYALDKINSKSKLRRIVEKYIPNYKRFIAA